MTDHKLSPSQGLMRLRRIARHIGPRRRVQFVGLFFLSMVGIVAELMTIGAVAPVLLVALEPEKLAQVPFAAEVIGGLARWLGVSLIASAAILLGGSALIATGVRLLLHWYSQRLVFALNHDLATGLYHRMLRQPFEWYSQNHSSIILSGIEKVYHVSVGVVLPLVTSLTSLLIAAFVTAMLFAINPAAAATAMVVVGAVYGALILFTRHRNHTNSLASASLRDERTKTLQESSGGIRDIILDQTQPIFEERFRRLDNDFNRTLVWHQLVMLMPRIIVEGALIMLIALLAIWFQQQPGGLFAALPALGAMAIGAQRLLPLVQQVYAGYSGYSLAIGNIDDVLDLLDAPLGISSDADTNVEPLPFTRSIDFSAVDFSYIGSHRALSSVNLSIRAGERIGIIGKTGSGKSTLIDILMGLLPPTSGVLSVDGVAIDSKSVLRWKRQIAHVPQFIFLADDSIAANVAFGHQHPDLARVARCLDQAGLTDFIANLPQGLDSHVGERGVRLSGGQRQRIGIARALYKDARLLVLDEATSSLDNETELHVMEAVNTLRDDLTIVIIAHRLTTVAGCDRIIRLDGGRIVEEGDYAQVIERTA